MEQHLAYIEKLVAKGGPSPSEYASFDRWLGKVARQYRAGKLREEDLSALREAFGEALSRKTLQGFSLQKPHGYTGDFEIIDRMYTKHVTGEDHLKNWDLYFQRHAGPTAVRNRKAYFLNLLKSMEAAHAEEKASLPVLNVASGPSRDVFEFFRGNGQRPAVRFECVDNDPKAIRYAKELCAPYLDRVTFHQANALRFRSEKRYQLVWSAGLFDYLGDKGFEFLLGHLLQMVRSDGELVVGNFSPRNPTRNYMEIVGDWHLYHRDAEELTRRALSCGIAEEDVRIGREPAGVNLFLHVKRGSEFLDLEKTS